MLLRRQADRSYVLVGFDCFLQFQNGQIIIVSTVVLDVKQFGNLVGSLGRLLLANVVLAQPNFPVHWLGQMKQWTDFEGGKKLEAGFVSIQFNLVHQGVDSLENAVTCSGDIVQAD